MVTRLITFLKQRDIDVCLERAQVAVRDWAGAWCAGEEPKLICEAAIDPSVTNPGGQWRVRKQTDGSSLWYYATAELERQIQALLFQYEDISLSADRHGRSQIADGIAFAAFEDLVSIMLNSLQVRCSAASESAEPPPSWIYARSSGAALLSIHIGRETIGILMPGTLFGRQRSTKVAARGELVPLTAALENVPVRMMVELGSIEMTVANWASLALGDVIQLPFDTDHTLAVITEDDRFVCAASLGSVDGHRAIEVIKAITH